MDTEGMNLRHGDIAFVNGGSLSTHNIIPNSKRPINLVQRGFHLINDNKIIQISKQRTG